MTKKLLAVLFASLTVTPLAHAQEPRPAGDPAGAESRHRLVGVILSTSQALLWDDESGEYQLRRVGDELYGGQIVAMEEDVVIVERGEAREEIGISSPPQRKVAARRSRRLPAMIIQVGPGAAADQPQALAPLAPQPAQPRPMAPQPTQPQVDAPPAAPPAALPALPQPAPQAPLLAPAPADALAPPAAAPAPAAPTYAPPAPEPQAAPAPAYAPPAPQPQAAPAPRVQADPRGVMPLSRAQLERELGAMGGPQQPVVLTANPQGGFRIAALRAGSLADSIGLRAGDVVLRIDGRPINGLGDAASAYAWLRLTEQFTIDVVRDGRLVTLRYAFTA